MSTVIIDMLVVISVTTVIIVKVKSDKDAELVKKLNDLITTPPPDPAAAFGGMEALRFICFYFINLFII
jgi:hypothetical protein